MTLQNGHISAIAIISLLFLGSGCGDDSGGDDGVASGSDTGSGGGDSTGDGPSGETITTTVSTVSAGDSGDSGDDDGSTTADDSDDSGDSGDSTGGPPALTCESYCSVYLDGCTDFSVYANEQDCMDHCGQWPEGTAEDTAGDTLGCRIYHATVASSTEPELHCPHSGPSGDGVCADKAAPDCATYCDTYMGNCTGDNDVYADLDDCMTQCAPWYPGVEGDTAGNSIGCRTYHGGVPALGDPMLHCPHAGPGGDGVCVFE